MSKSPVRITVCTVRGFKSLVWFTDLMAPIMSGGLQAATWLWQQQTIKLFLHRRMPRPLVPNKYKSTHTYECSCVAISVGTGFGRKNICGEDTLCLYRDKTNQFYTVTFILSPQGGAKSGYHGLPCRTTMFNDPCFIYKECVNKD